MANVCVFELEGHLRLTSEPMLTLKKKEKRKRKNVRTKCTSKRSGVLFFQEWWMKVCVIKVSFI